MNILLPKKLNFLSIIIKYNNKKKLQSQIQKLLNP